MSLFPSSLSEQFSHWTSWPRLKTMRCSTLCPCHEEGTRCTLRNEQLAWPGSSWWCGMWMCRIKLWSETFMWYVMCAGQGLYITWTACSLLAPTSAVCSLHYLAMGASRRSNTIVVGSRGRGQRVEEGLPDQVALCWESIFSNKKDLFFTHSFFGIDLRRCFLTRWSKSEDWKYRRAL